MLFNESWCTENGVLGGAIWTTNFGMMTSTFLPHFSFLVLQESFDSLMSGLGEPRIQMNPSSYI